MNIINKLSTTVFTAGLLVAALVLGTGCSKEGTQDVFDKSPAERLDTRSHELAERLISSPNGWIMEYIPNKKAEYGGYIIGFKFNDKGQVLISSEALENTTPGATELMHPPVKSTYVIGRDTGVTLNFPDYNEALHYYSTPDREYAAGLAKGYEGDYEFRYMLSENPDELYFIGKKTGNKIRMYRATEDAMEYVRKVVEMKRKLFSSSEMFAQHQDVLLSSKPILGHTDLKFYYPTVEGYNYYDGKTDEESELSTKLRFFYTPTGLEFFDPKTSEREAYTWNEGKRILEREGGAEIEARDDPYYDGYASYLGDYQLILLNTRNNAKETYDVKFEPLARNRYVITGLPYYIFADYDYKSNRFGISVQGTDNPNVVFTAVAFDKGGYLSFGRGVGVVSQLKLGSNSEHYVMVDNGVWGTCDSFAFWNRSEGKLATEYQPSAWIYPEFVRK